MKKIFITAGLLWAAVSSGQRYNNEPFDRQHRKFTADGGMLTLVAEKNLLELKEQTVLTVRINWVNSDEDASDMLPQQYDYRFEDPARAPWKITQWEILEGGGTLKAGTENYYAVYTAPGTMPSKKYAAVSVTLMPLDPTKPKVQLLQTIYFADNPVVFYFDCPYLGISQEKYVIAGNGGALAKTDALTQKTAAAKISSQNAKVQQRVQEYSIKAPAADITMAQHGLDLASLTSNVKALYVKEQDITSIYINDSKIALVNGQPTTNKRSYLIVISFPGKATGKFAIKSKGSITATITLPQMLPGYACSCSDDPEDKKRREEAGEQGPTCMGGNIYITKYDTKTKTIQGEVYAQLESADPNSGKVFYATLNGKFTVPLAN